MALLFAGVLLAARYLRPPLEHLGRAFVERFGPLGMALGSLLADGFHFPVPPQFYMVAAISGGAEESMAVAAICAGSLLGGQIGFLLSQQAARLPVLGRRLEHSRHVGEALLRKYGYWGIAVGSISPIPYSTLCYLAGVLRLPYKVFAWLSLFRVPVLVIFYLLIREGWIRK